MPIPIPIPTPRGRGAEQFPADAPKGAPLNHGVGRHATSTTINHHDETIMSQGIKTVIRGLLAGEAAKLPPPVKGKPAATKLKGAAGKGERSNATKSKSRPAATKPALLAGGNPQIAKAGGDAPVQAYIAAMPGWKRDVGRRLDAIIVSNVPNVRKAVKWNSPF
jgi:hypothetical protein